MAPFPNNGEENSEKNIKKKEKKNAEACKEHSVFVLRTLKPRQEKFTYVVTRCPVGSFLKLNEEDSNRREGKS